MGSSVTADTEPQGEQCLGPWGLGGLFPDDHVPSFVLKATVTLLSSK